MKDKKNEVVSHGLIWFGAAVSIAEILTGTIFAPLGFAKGMAAILIGHLIGCALLYFAGLIGAKTKKSAMETVKMSFGQKGSLIFSSLNVLQLVGWTAVMIISGAGAASAVLGAQKDWIWCLVIGALIILWVLIGIKNLGKLNILAMGALFLLTVFLSTVIFHKTSPVLSEDTISFGAAIELSIAMPLSWLPLISDYTRTSGKPGKVSAVSAITYFFISSWMYAIGLGATLFTGESEISAIMMQAGPGVAALLIIVFSTVTTTFLDVYSAGVSAVSISKHLKEKPVAIVICVVGMILAVFVPMAQYENFLYLIGSVFAPMISILIVDYFLFKKDVSGKVADVTNLVIWLIGFILYRVFLQIDTPLGNTIPVMLITAVLCYAVEFIRKKLRKA